MKNGHYGHLLSVRYIDTLNRHFLQGCLKYTLCRSRTRRSWSAFTCQVALKAYPLDLDTVRFHKCNDPGGGVGLSSIILEVVVVVVQFCVRVDFGCKFESKWDEGLANGVIEDRATISTIFLQS